MFSGHHERITKGTEARSVPEFLGENVTGVNLPWDVTKVDFIGQDAVADGAVTKVDVPHAFCSCSFGPVDRPLVVVVKACGRGCVR